MNQKPLHLVVGVSCGFYWVIEVGRWIGCFVGVEIRILCLADIVDYFLWNLNASIRIVGVPGTLYPPMGTYGYTVPSYGSCSAGCLCW